MKVLGEQRARDSELDALEQEAQTVTGKLVKSDKSSITYAVYLALRICSLLLKERKAKR